MVPVGLDDRNEGDEPGECVEHVWAVVEILLTTPGAYLGQKCYRCDAVQLVTPGDLTGRTG